MASADADETDPAVARELELLGKVELRFALADTDERVQPLLDTYLTPVLLKLESRSRKVREKVIKISQHVRARAEAPSIKLPVAALLKQFKEHDGLVLRQFDTLYIELGLGKMTRQEKVDLLPVLLKGFKKLTDDSQIRGSLVFNLVIRVLPFLQFPTRGQQEDSELRAKFGFSDDPDSALVVAEWLGKLIVFTPQATWNTGCPGLRASEYLFLNPTGLSFSWDPQAEFGQNLAETKVAAARFLASGAFTDLERFIPALFASADTNSRIADVGDDVLKRFTPDMENRELVDRLFRAITGTSEDGGALPVRPRLQAKILSYLSKSKAATTFVDPILQLIDTALTLPSEPNYRSPEFSKGLEALKLRSQIFSFISWTTRIGSEEDLQRIASPAIRGLRVFIESQGWPNPSVTGQKLRAADISVRSNAYEAIGILAPKLQSIKDDENLELLRWLFTSLSSDASDKQMFVSIEQALGSIINVYADDTPMLVQEHLQSLLLHHMNLKIRHQSEPTDYTIVRSTRFAAVRFANRCLPYNDVKARWIDILAIGGGPEERHEVVEEGRKGLDPYWYRMLNPKRGGSWTPKLPEDDNAYTRYNRPGLRELVSYFFPPIDMPGKASSGGLAENFSGHSGYSFAPAVSFCRNILIWEAMDAHNVPISPSTNWDNELDASVTINEDARAAVRAHLRTSHEDTILTLFHALLTGLLWSQDSPMGRTGEQFAELCSLSANEIVAKFTGKSREILQLSLSSSNNMIRETASHVYGMIASHPDYGEHDLIKDMEQIITRISSWRSAIGQAINSTHGAIVAGSYILGRLAIRNRLSGLKGQTKDIFLKCVVEILTESSDLTLTTAAQTALGQLSVFSVISADDMSLSDTASSVIEKLIRDAKKEHERPIISLGRFAMIFTAKMEQFTKIIESLYLLHEVRRPEVQFAVGEALATVAAQWSSKSLMTILDVDVEKQNQDFDHDNFSEMLEKIIEDCRNTKPSLKKGAAIWLLCMIQYCGHLPEIKARLRKFQATFGSLLSDRDEIVQETGSRGLGLVYEIGDNDLKDSLVRDLVKSFTSTNSSLGGTVSEDTELFDPGALPTGDGSITTYKDIMSLASEVGDPSLVYRFMNMASNNAIWSSRAAFGRFGLSNVLSDSSVNGYLAQNPKLYPVLFRYKHDPNPNVRRSMNEIWSALVKDPNAIIEQHFNAIMDDLLKSILGREWRVREASCAAIADLVQGREIEKLERYLHDIWNAAFKVLDDIKETVRVAALSLCQVLSNLLLRSLEVGETSSKRSQTMLDNVLPFLLSPSGLESSAKEVQVYSIKTLLNIIKKAPAPSLRRFIPELLEKLIESLSTFEPEEVNYFHMNADKYNTTASEIDQIRLSGIRKSPLTEALERCLDGLDAESIKQAVTKLEETMKSSVGLPSKIGCSRVIISLSTRQNVLFRPYADRVLQHLRRFVLDRNNTVSASYCSAIGYIMRLATEKQVLQTVDYAKKLYFDYEDPKHRSVSGEIIYSTSKLSNDRFNSVATAILPFVFVAKQDEDIQVKELFVKTWQDNVGGSRAVALYLPELVQIISGHLESPRWTIKHASALAVSEAVTSFEGEINPKECGLIWPTLERALAGKTWDGKEVVLKAFVRFTRKSRAYRAANIDVEKSMETIAFREAKRTNPQYRKFALRCLGEYAQIREDHDMSTEVFKVVHNIVDDVSREGSTHEMEIDSGPATATTENLSQEIMAATVDCLFRCIHPNLIPVNALTARLRDVLAVIQRTHPYSSNSFRLSIFDGAKILMDRMDQHRKEDNPVNAIGAATGRDEGEFRDLQQALDDFSRKILVGPSQIPEHLRAKQAEAWLAFASWHQRRDVARQSIPSLPAFSSLSWVGQATRDWLAQERSGRVQQILQLAREKFDSLALQK